MRTRLEEISLSRLTATIRFFAGVRRLAFREGHGAAIVAFKRDYCDVRGGATRAGDRRRYVYANGKTCTAFAHAE